ncbi:MAG: FAD-dependent oxidoreductase [Beijerinckiaceae bacterium]|nr:FAD-dependent oxidoreductase [Beijerinckiaceae bacterium]
MSSKPEVDVIVVGGGIFGCLSAIELAKRGLSVKLLEQNADLMKGATLNNQNRLHLGYHYPRDVETAKQCQRGFDEFRRAYPECILSGFDNAYFISSENSKVGLAEYSTFCDNAGLPFNELRLQEFGEAIKNVDGGILTEEVVYDSKLLSERVLRDLTLNNVEMMCHNKVSKVEETDFGFDVCVDTKKLSARAIVNCTYANFNAFNTSLGLPKKQFQYELTVVPIVRWRQKVSPIGITIMDGPFFTILPFGKSGDYLLYHVNHTVFQSVIGESYPLGWADPKKVINRSAAEGVFEKMVISSEHWLPSIRSAEFVDYLAAVRVVFADSDATDRRPSLVERLPTRNPFISIFSGKIDHSIWVSRDVADALHDALKVRGR